MTPAQLNLLLKVRTRNLRSNRISEVGVRKVLIIKTWVMTNGQSAPPSLSQSD